MNTFSEIIGQDIIISHLQNALRTGGVSHAYILNGAKGSGRHMIARSFSAALLCDNPRQEGELLEPCGECLSCIQTEAGSNPDLITVEYEKESSIGVGDIRRMRADVRIKPYSAAHKIYIIPDAEKMTPAAQNALLKTLEEPPSYAVIFLLADGTSTFLPTIMSRCVTLPLRPVAEKAVEDCLKERFGADADRARLCARFSGGSIGRAVHLLENDDFATLREKTITLLRKIEEADASELASFAKEAAGQEQTQDLIDLILKRLIPIAAVAKVELVGELGKPVEAEVDATKLTLAVTNLVENAIKYNHEGGWVHVSLNSDSNFFFIKVEDNGMGIPQEDQEHIFERFYRVDKSHSREIGGTGLGLAITRSAVEMHHGAVRVYSREGEGTTFTIRIPLRYERDPNSSGDELIAEIEI